MKKILLAVVAFTFSAATFAQQPARTPSIEIGTAIPMADVSFKSVNSKPASLNNLKTEKGLLVMFSCNTCPYVIKSQPRTKEIIAYAKEKGIGMIIVNSNEAQRDEEDSYEAMQVYAKKQGYKVPYVMDDQSKLANAFGANRTPEVFLFDNEGKLIYKGAMEDNPGEPTASKEMFLKDAIDNMLAHKPISPNSTRSVGCSIKRAS